MRAQTRRILIESILGGHCVYGHFAQEDEYLTSYGIDPTMTVSGVTNKASGIIVNKLVSENFSSTELTDTPLWLMAQPKSVTTFVYGSAGSVYTIADGGIGVVSPLAKIADASGNGMEYYDNYMYFASGTTIARYGPLNGAPAMNNNFWADSLLTLAGLTDTTYPTSAFGTIKYPNHVMLRHDGALYFADVVGNQGVLHKIKTSKTTVEGDTNAGSAFNVIDFPHGMWITALASLGDKIIIALYEGSNSTSSFQSKAKLAIWDPTNPTSYDFLTDEEFPDPIITALLNSNGILYIFSGALGENNGVRVTRMTSNGNFEQIGFINESVPPLAGGVDGVLNRIVFGGEHPDGGGVVWAIGTHESPISGSIFCPIKNTSAQNYGTTAVKFIYQSGLTGGGLDPVIGFGNGSASSNGINNSTQTGITNTSEFISRLFRIGQKFKITKIAIPMGYSTPAASRNITVLVFLDEINTAKTIGTIDTNSHISGRTRIIFRPINLTGENSFSLKLLWSCQLLYPVALPISIEYELLND